MEETIKGIITVKVENGKAIKVNGSDNFYGAFAAATLNGFEKGDNVLVTYVTKGVFKNIKKIEKIKAEVKEEAKQEVRESATGFVCEDCGKALKDDKYKKCFLCNKKNPTFKSAESKPAGAPYNNPERDAQIRRGNALNAAGAAISGNYAGSDPETVAEALLIVAQKALDWLDAA